MIDLEQELLRRDVHPAEAVLPDGRVLTGLRVFITSHRLLGYQATEAREIERVLDAELADPWSVPADRATLKAGRLECVTADGTVWVNRGRGCGCGSPLKALSAPAPWARR